MKKRFLSFSQLLLCTVLLFSISSFVRAQQAQPEMYKVKGVLLDSITNVGEPYATLRLALKSNMNKPEKLAVTDNKGKFSLEVPKPGSYVLTISSVGKTTIVRNIALSSSNRVADLGKLFSVDSKNQLGNVTIVAQKPLVKVDLDKIEYDVKSDPESKTNKVLDMLRKVPLVTVDGQDNIQVNGSDNFKIYVNGKPSTLVSTNPGKVLKSMPANAIKNIEVITNPGAKYDAEGVGGILNIVMDENSGMQGYTATFNASAGTRDIDGGAYVIVQKNKLTLSSNFNMSKDFSKDLKDEMTRTNLVDETNKYLTQTGSTKNYGRGFYGTLEGSYEFSKKNLLSASFMLYGGHYNADADFATLMQNSLLQNQYSYRNINQTDMKYNYLESKVDFQHSFSKPGEMLTFSFRMSNTPASNNNSMFLVDPNNKFTYTNKRTDADMKSPDFTYQVDYTKPMFKTGSLQTGVKYISRDNISTSFVERLDRGTTNWIVDNDNSVDYKHMQDILAGYLSYSQKFGKFSAKGGVRYEYTGLKVKFANKSDLDFDKKLSDWVPSGSLSYSLAQTKTLRLSYNMGIRRPSIWFLNPYKNTSNPNVITYGNPQLDSEKNHSFNLNFSSFSQNFNLNMGLGHSFVNNSIQQYSFINKAGILETTYDNIGHARSTNITAYVSWSVFPQTRLSLNEALSYKVIESKAGTANENAVGKNSGFENSLFGSVQQTFPKSLVLSLNGGFSTSRIGLQGTRTGFKHYTLSLNKSFMKEDRLTIGAFATNIFAKNIVFGSNNSTPNFIDSSKSYYPMRSFGVSVSYRIGKLEAQVKKAARSITNDDVMQGDSGQGGRK